MRPDLVSRLSSRRADSRRETAIAGAAASVTEKSSQRPRGGCRKGVSRNRTPVAVFLGQDHRQLAVKAVISGDQTPVTASLLRCPVVAGDPLSRKVVTLVKWWSPYQRWWFLLSLRHLILSISGTDPPAQCKDMPCQLAISLPYFSQIFIDQIIIGPICTVSLVKCIEMKPCHWL